MYNIYVVEYGDTLKNIANKFNTSEDILNRLNGTITNVYPGMQIIVPKNDSVPYITYKVEKGDSVYSVANKYGADYREILLLNGLNENDYIYPNQQLIILKNDYNMYITEDNDTLNRVAGKLNMSAEKIVSQNASIYLMPGQAIIYKKEKSI